jgi:hypothetical protein
MKKFVLFSALLFISLFNISAQDCNAYYPLNEGEVREYTTFDKKGKESGTTTHKIVYVDEEDGVINAEMEVTGTYNGKKELDARNFQVSCEDGIYTMDLRGMLGPEVLGSLGQNNDSEVEVSGTALEMPKNLEVGQELNDANISFTFGPIKGSMLYYNRTVTSKDEITTAAGSFPCYKIEYDLKMKMLMGKNMHVEEYFAEGIGMVSSKTYNAKGKLMSSTELTRFDKP